MASGSVLAKAGIAALGLLLAGCVGGPGGNDDGDGDIVETPRFGFGAPVAVSPDPAGSEPGILATRDGSLYVVSVLGSAEERGDGLWKSLDDGATWAYLGKPDYPFGGGDADLDEDDAGTLYLPGQWRAVALPVYLAFGESMAVSRDGGATWTVNPIASDAPATDRQWTATVGAGTAYLAFNQMAAGLMVTKSTDSGLTWTQAVPVEPDGPGGIPGDILVDPADGMLMIPYAPSIGGGGGPHRLFLSLDGQTFVQKVIHESPSGRQASAIFGTLALDREGRLYYTWSEETEAGMAVFVTHSADRGDTWSNVTRVTPEGTTAVFPWMVVGDPGRIAVSYYAANGTFVSDAAPEGTPWRPYVTFLDGLFDAAPYTLTVALSPTPNHYGPLCTGGTGCDAAFRRLGDFFEIGLTPDGRVAAVWVDDSTEADGGPRLNVVAVQNVGSLVAAPLP